MKVKEYRYPCLSVVSLTLYYDYAIDYAIALEQTISFPTNFWRF